MSALTFSLKSELSCSVDCSSLTPDKLANLSLEQIEKIVLDSSLSCGKVVDWFTVSGDDSRHIVFENAHACLHHIGQQMTQGVISIEGNAGNYLGQQMQGGTIVCKGNAGDRVGDKMRRGMILVEGDVADYCGASMVAGTIGVLGDTGNHLGYGLKRGTLLLANTPKLSATWLDCGLHNLPFLHMLYQSFCLLDTKFAQLKQLRVRRWMGDVSQTGKGEILVLQ